MEKAGFYCRQSSKDMDVVFAAHNATKRRIGVKGMLLATSMAFVQTPVYIYYKNIHHHKKI
jgi:hypothetical protein